MYDPHFNSVLVEIDDKDAEWGSGNDESMLGKSYSKGKVIKVGSLVQEQTHPWATLGAHMTIFNNISALKNKNIIWNEGVEAGTTFEHNGKFYGFIYWWDIRGMLVK